MSTIDLTKVAGFKAVDAEGNDMGIVSLSEMTNMVKESIIQEAVAMQSVSTLAETSTLAATDTYEDKLDISDTFSYVRTLDSSGNPKRTSQNALATVVGGLIGVATTNKNGLYPSTEVKKTQRTYDFNPGQTIDTGFMSGLITIGSTITGGSAVFCFGFNTTNRTDIAASAAFDIDNLYVYKESNDGNILIKNNRDAKVAVWYSILTGY